MSLTTPYREQFLEADGITTTFPFDDHGDGFDAISKNYVKCEVYNADGSVIVPEFTVDLSAKTITITSLSTPDGQVLNAPQSGAIVRIYRDVPEAQNTTAQALQSSTAQQIVQNFDNIVAMVQELQYANEHFTLRSTLPQRDLQIDLLRDIDDQKLVYWDNEKRKLVVTNYRQDELLLPADKEDILAQANAYSDEQNAVLESRINGKLTAVDAQIDANANAILKTREDYIQADSEIHQILNNHADELTTLRGNQASLGVQVSNIEHKIPESASGSNPLITKQQLQEEEMDIRDDLNSGLSELQTQITAQAAEIATKQDQLVAGDNIVISGNTISATGTGGVGFDMQVVNQLPATGEKGVIYLVPKDGAAPDVHDEYVWIDATQTFELIGTTQVDLTGYVKNTDYPLSNKPGVVQQSLHFAFGASSQYPYAVEKTLAQYTSATGLMFIGKNTLENIKNDLVKRAVTTNDITLTDDEKAAAQAWLGVSGGGGGGIANVAHDSTLTGNGTASSPLGLSEAIKDEISNKLDKEYASDFRGEWLNYASVPSDSNAYPADTLGSHIPNFNDYIIVKDSSDYFVASSKNLLEADVVGTVINSTPTAKFIVNYDVWYLGVAYNGYMGSNVPLNTFHSGVGTISFISNSADSYGVCRFVRLKPNTTYTISAKNGGRCAIASLTDEGGGYSKFSTPIQTPTSLPITFTTNDNSTYGIVLYANSQGTECTFEEIQLEVGSVATSYAVSGGYYLEGTWRFKYAGAWDTNNKAGWTPEYRLDIDISHINNESIQTKDLTVGTDEGTINIGIVARTATIATNTGLDIVSQTKFDTAPTTDDTTTWANANDTSLVTKRQVATALSESGDCGLIIRRL